MGLFTRFLAMLGFATAPATAGDEVAWPKLPLKGFVTGKAATIDDTKRSDAAFSMDGRSHGPLPIAVPQYVRWTDENGVKHPMILIQAEQAPDGSKIVGLRDFEGRETVATLSELTLLGTKRPN